MGEHYYEHTHYDPSDIQPFEKGNDLKLNAEIMIGTLLFCSLLSNLCKCFEIGKLKWTHYKKNKELDQILVLNDSDDICSICLDNYKKKEKIIRLDCQHMFHKKCFQEWLKTGQTCPLCRIII